jgi:LysM repeat protein
MNKNAKSAFSSQNCQKSDGSGTNAGSASYADFSESLDPYNSFQQGSAGGGIYTVRSGDTLHGIAAELYGDGNLWYRIAEANGLSAGAALSEGQSLILPAGVTKSTHNASTFQPYDASEALGDTLPTTPKPPTDCPNTPVAICNHVSKLRLNWPVKTSLGE